MNYSEQLESFTNWVEKQVGKRVDCKQVFDIHLWNERYEHGIPDYSEVIHVELNHRGHLEGFMLSQGYIGVTMAECFNCTKTFDYSEFAKNFPKIFPTGEYSRPDLQYLKSNNGMWDYENKDMLEMTQALDMCQKQFKESQLKPCLSLPADYTNSYICESCIRGSLTLFDIMRKKIK